MFYVNHFGKKLFYYTGYDSIEWIRRSYNAIAIEQDDNSPHRYLTPAFQVDADSVILDIGAEEGNFSIEVIEKAKHLYIFETEEEWIPALEKTFAP